MAAQTNVIETIFAGSGNLVRVLEQITVAAREAKTVVGGLSQSVGALNARLARLTGSAQRSTVALERLGVAGKTGMMSAVTNAGALESRLGRVRAAATMASRAVMGVGIASAGALAVGIHGAAGIQGKINEIAVLNGKSSAATAAELLPRALQTSMSKGMSLDQALGISHQMRMAIPNAKVADALTPAAASLANILSRTGHNDKPEEVAAAFGRVSHMLGAFSVGENKQVADVMYRGMLGTHTTVSQMANQLGYMSEIGSRAGLSRKSIMQQAVISDQFQHGRFGPAVEQLIRDIFHPTTGLKKAQINYGLRDKKGKLQDGIIDSAGKLDLDAFYRSAYKRLEPLKPAEQMKALAELFHTRAGRLPESMGTLKALRYAEQVKARQAAMPTIDKAEAQLMHGLIPQTQRLIHAFENLAIVLASPLIEPLTNGIQKFADVVSKITTFFADPAHEQARKFGTGALVAGAGLGVLGLGRAGLGLFAGLTGGHGGKPHGFFGPRDGARPRTAGTVPAPVLICSPVERSHAAPLASWVQSWTL